jgi:hypothetical protein
VVVFRGMRGLQRSARVKVITAGRSALYEWTRRQAASVGMLFASSFHASFNAAFRIDRIRFAV